MANENYIGWKPITLKSGAAISRGQGVKLDGTNSKQVVKTAAATDLCIGVALEAASASGEFIAVMPIGPIVKGIAGAATTINAELSCGGTTDGGFEDVSGAVRTVAVGLEAAGAAGDLIEMILVQSTKGLANS